MKAGRWISLLMLSVAGVVGLTALNISAALLIGPMAAAIVLAAGDRPVRIPSFVFLCVQAVVGTMIARVFSFQLLAEAGRRWPIFLFAVASVLAAACLLGFALTRWRILPGTTALWGAFPGAATTMVLMAGDFGADMRLVAFMQYLRVVLVAIVASAVARVVVPGGTRSGGLVSALAALIDPGHVDGAAFAATLSTAAVGALAALTMRVPAGALLGPMVLGAVAQNCGLVAITLPAPLLAASYALVGWSVGMRFDGAAIATAARALPRVAMALVALIAGCAALSVLLARLADVDPLTAYLAMSPGGADSVAIIAASVPKVDVAFVMSLQVARFTTILLCGPSLARLVARWAERDEEARAVTTERLPVGDR